MNGSGRALPADGPHSQDHIRQTESSGSWSDSVNPADDFATHNPHRSISVIRLPIAAGNARRFHSQNASVGRGCRK